MAKKKELSIFIDESGEISAPCSRDSIVDAFYIVSLVMHPQHIDLSAPIDKINTRLNNLRERDVNDRHAVHSYNLIRGDKPYRAMGIKQRRKMFNYIVDFAVSCSQIGVSAKRIIIDRRLYLDSDAPETGLQCVSEEQITFLKYQIRIELLSLLTTNLSDLKKYDVIKIYYDNGQTWLGQIIHEVMDRQIPQEDVIFKEGVAPEDFKLFQVADLLCTISVLQQKLKFEKLSNNDVSFFGVSSNKQARSAKEVGQKGQSYIIRQTREQVNSRVQVAVKKVNKLYENAI
ncbi:MAG: hypothetical protein ABF806_06545 [Bifidobacterium psychraerophilum]|uniref:DUF3800 domain-containing protein n=1 Tax=Bifidobacterium psychraerophilum TaxID=218140 RepID=UPI0039EB2FDE